jgi:endonuclease IV
MKRPYCIGAGVRSDDLLTFSALSRLYGNGSIDHIQVLIIPEHTRIFRGRLDEIAASDALIYIHAPHHGQGVNPCAPAAFEKRPLHEMVEGIEQAMMQTFEAADRLSAPLIVLHAGRYEAGGKQDAMTATREFLAQYRDPRIILENLPEVYDGYHLLGSTESDLSLMGKGLVGGYCLDFAHLYCTANYLNLSFGEELARFEAVPVKLFHLSNSERNSITDQHLELDHPGGGIDFSSVIRYIKNHPTIHTSLEYKENCADIYARQLEVFNRYYHKYG